MLIHGIVVVHGGNHEVHPSSLDVLDSLLVESRLGKVRVGTVTVEVIVWKMVIGPASDVKCKVSFIGSPQHGCMVAQWLCRRLPLR